MRLFVGVPLADAAARELAAVVRQVRGSEGGAWAGALRWTEPDSWHITLQFLGNTTEQQLECLRARLSAVRSAPVPVALAELGCFDRAGVFFVNVTVTPELAALQRCVTAAASLCGFVAEARPFHPHITLARAKGQGHGAGLRALQGKIQPQARFTRFTAREFLLYESHLGHVGARYEIRQRFELQRA
jgi:RNA 2',3'-cyclic 3'-phosphodiesterase